MTPMTPMMPVFFHPATTEASDMTPEQFKSIRLRANLTQPQLAERLGLPSHRTIQAWESGQNPIPGPAAILMEQMCEATPARRTMKALTVCQPWAWSM